ncbi:MAG TPA: glycosyltransferase family 2 protein [Acidimicrobiales bacterium]|nr:glycosyltransferase family 2 protein [Acidimicrobiales bacterium]
MSTSAGGGPVRFRVLLSTYNGARFLRDQIESVLTQGGVQVALHVRDDGSTDATRGLLAELASRDGRVTFEIGQHRGPALSYLTMLSNTSPDTDFVALCDQDDVWIDGKLARSARWLSRVQGPAMYCSAVEVVDDTLQPIGMHRTCRRGPALENALVQNIATGCTIVVNRSALSLFRVVPEHAVMHDWWIYAALTATGIVRYDPTPWVLYRQHESNSIGLAGSHLSQWARRLRQQAGTGNERSRTRQAQELLDLLGPTMPPLARSTLSRFVRSQSSLGPRVMYALTGPAFRQRRIDSVVFRVLYAMGRT